MGWGWTQIALNKILLKFILSNRQAEAWGVASGVEVCGVCIIQSNKEG